MYVATSIPMSQHRCSATSANWCHDPTFHVLPWISVATMFSWSRHVVELLLQIGVATQLSCQFWFLLQHCLALLSSRSQPKKSIAIDFCCHLACFLVAASFFMLRPRLLCWGCFACRDLNMLCRDNTYFACSIFSCRNLVFLLRHNLSAFSLSLCRDPFSLSRQDFSLFS